MRSRFTVQYFEGKNDIKLWNFSFCVKHIEKYLYSLVKTSWCECKPFCAMQELGPTLGYPGTSLRILFFFFYSVLVSINLHVIKCHRKIWTFIYCIPLIVAEIPYPTSQPVKHHKLIPGSQLFLSVQNIHRIGLFSWEKKVQNILSWRQSHMNGCRLWYKHWRNVLENSMQFYVCPHPHKHKWFFLHSGPPKENFLDLPTGYKLVLVWSLCCFEIVVNFLCSFWVLVID